MFEQVIPISYGIAAAAYVFAAVLLATTRTQHRYKLLLLGASISTALWAISVVASSLLATPPFALVPVVVGLELVRSLGWIAVLGFVLFHAYAKRVDRNVAVVAIGATGLAVAYVLGVAVAAAFGAEVTAGLLRMTFTARVLIAVAGLLMVENLFRNSGQEGRWAVKYLCFGLGILFTYDFFIYADAALIDRIDGRFYAARGIVEAMAVPLVIIAAARSRSWPIDLHVSRQLVFHSATLLAAGAYLLVMAMVGYSLRVLDSPWGTVAQASFLSAAVLVLAVVLASGRFQARLRDFISRNFFSYKYDYRKEWLRFIAAISGSLTELTIPERIIRALANILESTSGALWVRREDDGVFQLTSAWNMGRGLTAIDATDPFIIRLTAAPTIVDLDRYACDGAGTPDLPVPQVLRSLPRAWLVVPLVHAGDLLGFVVLGEARTRTRLGWEDIELLKTAGCQAASYIAEANAARSLAQARRFEEFNRQFAFVIHDIKNLAGQMTLIVKNAERHGDNPEFQKDVLKTVSHSVGRMKTMLEQLRAGGAQPPKSAPIDICALLRRHTDAWKLQVPHLDVDVPQEPITILGDTERLDAVFNHLLQNALDAAGEHGHIGIELHIEGVGRNGGAANDELWSVIAVSDDGPGMDPAFVDQKLFQPLNSAKPAGFGIGAFQARQLIREMGGKLDVDTCLGKGTRMIVRMPLVRAPGAVKEGAAMDVAAAPIDGTSRQRRVSYG
jgi:putative PEP-CTERM system histidine kinase